jgi:hypothetical protein
MIQVLTPGHQQVGHSVVMETFILHKRSDLAAHR